MKKVIIITLVFFIFSFNAVAQCPEDGTEVPIGKIMNSTMAKDYTDCDIVIEASFIFSSVSTFKHPGKFKKSVVFQVSPVGEEDNYKDARGQRGLFVAVSKEDSDKIFELSKGNKLKIRGNTYIKYSLVYFIASSYEVL